MTIHPASFEDVFDGQSSFAPCVIISASLSDVASQLGASTTEGVDGLDGFTAVPLTMDGPDGPVRFALWRHAGNPVGTFAIHMALEEPNVPDKVPRIMRGLKLHAVSIIWRSWDKAPSDGNTRVMDRLTA